MVKKFNKIEYKGALNVLILDEAGSEFICKCIPGNLSTIIVPIRNGIPYFAKPVFFLFLLKRIFQFGFRNKALMSAIVDVVRPKVIISFIDNSSIMGELNSIFPRKLVISVQNGVRVDSNGFFNCNTIISLPHYFSFGDYEKDFVNRHGIEYENIYSSGSLKFSLFVDEYKKHPTNINAVCFISQYWPLDLSSPHKQHCHKIFRKVFINLALWNVSHKQTKVKVAMRNRVHDMYYYDELNFYNKEKVDIIEQSNFSSYRAGFESSVSITMFSTLGFELFGFGKKVLFCGMATNGNFIEDEAVRFFFHKLPNFILLDSLDIAEFNSKINALISMSESEYLEKTKEAREYYMKYGKNKTHNIISEFINDFIN